MITKYLRKTASDIDMNASESYTKRGIFIEVLTFNKLFGSLCSFS
jgi:hypothetical protein